MKEHRILIIGPGGVSEVYVDKIAGIDGMSVAGVVGRSADKTKAYAETHGIPSHGTQIEKIAKDSNATMALVCTPNATHYEGVCAAAKLGIDVLCEKPLHITAQKQEEMIRLCRQNNVKLGVCFQGRFRKSTKHVKELLDAGRLGRIMVMDVRFKAWRDPEYYSESSWHGTWEIDGGGPFIQQGAHIIDIALWLSNGFEEVIDARTFTLSHPIDVEDHGYALVKFANGAIGSVQASTTCKGIYVDEVEISTAKGNLTIAFDGTIKQWDIDELEKPDFSDDQDVIRELLVDFKEAVETDRTPFVSGESSRATVELIQEIYRKAGTPLRG